MEWIVYGLAVYIALAVAAYICKPDSLEEDPMEEYCKLCACWDKCRGTDKECMWRCDRETEENV